MLGTGAVSEFAVSEILIPATHAAAGTAVGISSAHGAARKLGVNAAAGTAIGVSFAQGQTFKLGLGGATRNQQFDFSVNALQALLWQYNKAPKLTALLKAKQSWYDKNQTAFWENWFLDVFNIPTANDFGCAVWSVILGLSLVVEYNASDGANWGFGPYQQNFEHGNFAPAIVEPLSLTLDQKRLILQLRYFQLITRGFVPDINRMLSRLFKSYGKAYVVDGLDMTMTYVFLFNLPAHLSYIFKYYDLLPAPAGVKVTFISNGQSVGTAKGEAFAQGVT